MDYVTQDVTDGIRLSYSFSEKDEVRLGIGHRA
jgi:hypothetical protein